MSGRVRWVYLSIALLVIPLGLLARSMRSGADDTTVGGFIATYAGDTLWAVMFFFFFAAVRPRARTIALGAVTLAFTLGIEASQLYHGEPLATLRSISLMRFLLGSQFLWSDVACLIVGTALSTALHRVIAVKQRPGRV